MIAIREASAEDAPAVARVLAASGRGPWDADRLRPAFGRLVLVAEQDGAVVACARTSWTSDSDGAAAAGHYLGGLVVEPEARRQGVGSALTGARLAWLRERTDVVHSIVNTGNVASLALHAGLGFVQVARGARFHRVQAHRPGDELVLLRLDLLPDLHGHVFETG